MRSRSADRSTGHKHVKRRFVAAVSIAAALVVVGAPAPSAPSASASPIPVISAAQLADPVFMEAFYRQWFTMPLPDPGPAEDIATCTPAAPPAALVDAEITRINAYRAIAGVPSTVVENASWSGDAEAGALAWAGSGFTIPTPGSPCYTGLAQAVLDSEVVSIAGLEQPYGPPLGSDVLMSRGVWRFGAPVGNPGIDRATVLWPSLGQLGFGAARSDGANGTVAALEVFVAHREPNVSTPRPLVRDSSGLVAWPPCGSAVPYQLAAGTWSLSKPGLQTQGATISITRDGASGAGTWLRHRVDDDPGEDVSLYYPLDGSVLPPPGSDGIDVSVSIDGATIDGNPTPITCSFTVIDVNFAPIHISVGPSTVLTSAPPGSVVGALSNWDQQGGVPNSIGSTYMYELVSGEGDADNAQFAIVNGQLVTTSAFAGLPGARTIRVRVTENRPNGVFEMPVTVTVVLPSTPPPPLSHKSASVVENQAAGTLLVTLPATDDFGRPVSYSLAPGPATSYLQIVGNELRTSVPLDYEQLRSLTFTVVATNAHGSTNNTFYLEVLDVADSPGPPRQLQATAVLPGELEMTWLAPNVGGQPTHYTISWPGGSVTLDSAARSYRITGLGSGATTVTVTASNQWGSAAASTTSNAASGTNWLTAFTPMPPVRLLDTRPAASIGFAGPKPVAGQVIELQVTGLEGIPDDAVAVALNVTATDATDAGYITVFPAGGAPPNVSSLNVRSGGTVANSVIVKLGADGKLALYTERGSHLIVDIAGYWRYAEKQQSSSGRVRTLTPARILDTRTGVGRSGPKPITGETFRLQVLGTGGIPASGVSAVILNVTATDASAAGYVTVWPAGLARPNASNLNVSGPGQTVANQVIVPVGADGGIELYTEQGSHLIADVSAYITDSTALSIPLGLFHPMDPYREVDTRTWPDIPKVPSGYEVLATHDLQAPIAVPPEGIEAFALNVTATDNDGAGFVSVYPCDEGFTGTSTLNLNGPGETVPNAATAATYDVCVGTSVDTHLIVDIFGWYHRF